MEFVSGVIDAGAPEFYVSGVASAEIIDNCLVRVTFYTENSGHKVVAARLILSIPAWQKSREVMTAVQEAIDFGCDATAKTAPGLAPH